MTGREKLVQKLIFGAVILCVALSILTAVQGPAARS